MFFSRPKAIRYPYDDRMKKVGCISRIKNAAEKNERLLHFIDEERALLASLPTRPSRSQALDCAEGIINVMSKMNLIPPAELTKPFKS